MSSDLNINGKLSGQNSDVVLVQPIAGQPAEEGEIGFVNRADVFKVFFVL